MAFTAVHTGILRIPELHDTHKPFKVAANPTAGNYNPFWMQLGWPRKEKNYFRSCPSSASAQKRPGLEDRVFWEFVTKYSAFQSPIALFWLPYICCLIIFRLGKALEMSLQTHMPEVPTVKYSSLISMNSSTEVSVPCTSSKSLIFLKRTMKVKY